MRLLISVALLPLAAGTSDEKDVLAVVQDDRRRSQG
jgi:hypothetical protein